MSPILTQERLAQLAGADAKESWAFLRAWSLDAARPPYGDGGWERDLQRREKEFGNLDLFLAHCGWESWEAYESTVPLTADVLAHWWKAHEAGGAFGRAILILDGLSLRELPWLLEGAKAHGLTVDGVQATGAEIPSDTNAFAKALGFAQRSAVANNHAGSSHRLPGATTDLLECPFEDAAGMVGTQRDLFVWHTFPDDRLHHLADPGNGLLALAKETRRVFTSAAFWEFVKRLAQGRKLVITGDHGYAATGVFPDASASETKYLAGAFGAQRFKKESKQEAKQDQEAVGAEGDMGPAFLPPLDLRLPTRHGDHRLVLGRKKWKVAGGYPTLAHGGLSLLEALVPFVELSQ